LRHETRHQTRSNPTTQTLPRTEEKTLPPTLRHTSLPAHSDENWNTPNPLEP
jgi:hypothetical protein